MAVHERSSTERVQEGRERYVARGISTPPLVVERAEGARVWDAEGREYVDFAGGLGCANLGHSLPAVVDAVHAQVDKYLHQCFMVGMYEPYVEVCRRLAELSPCRGENQKSVLLNSRRRGDRERRQDRARRDRPPGRGRLRRRVPRAHAADDDDDLEGRPLQGRLRPVRARGLPHARRRTRSAGSARTTRSMRSSTSSRATSTRSSVACAVLEPVQGEGGFIPMTPDFPKRLQELLDHYGILYVDDEVQSGCGRTGPGLGDRALRRRARPARQRQDARRRSPARRGHRPRRGDGRRAARRARRHVRRQPRLVRRRDRDPRRARRAAAACRGRRRSACASGSRRWRRTAPRCAGSARCSRSSCPSRTGEETSRITAAARERGLLLLSCGLYGNVIRILVPFTISDDDLEKGLDILEGCLGS